MVDSGCTTSLRNDNKDTKSAETDKLSSLHASGALTDRGKSAYLKHVKKDATLIGSSIQLKLHAPCPATEAASKVFNIPELLEMILCQLKPGHILKSKSVCKGFRNAIQASKTMREKTSFFIEMDDSQEYGYFFNLGPQVPIIDHTKPTPAPQEYFYFTFVFTKSLPFTKMAQTPGFRQLRLFKEGPRGVKVGFRTQTTFHRRASLVLPPSGGAITMGQIFDVVTGITVSPDLVESFDTVLTFF